MGVPGEEKLWDKEEKEHRKYDDIRIYTDEQLKNYTEDELKNFNETLLSRRQIIVLNKVDLLDNAKQFQKIATFFANKNISVLAISALTGSGIDTLKQYLTETLEERFDG